MRDAIQTEEYFREKARSNAARIEKFETSLRNTEPANERGLRLGKAQLAKLYLDGAKAAYSLGADLREVSAYYIQAVNYYKDVCAPVDSVYGMVDYLSLGVLFQKSKAEFLPGLESMAGRFHSQDGLLCFLLQYLQDKPLKMRQSECSYFNHLATNDDKAAVLSSELSHWYQHHKDASWYNSHQSKNHTYCGYWCFEIAALARIFEIDDKDFALNPYYPYDLVHC